MAHAHHGATKVAPGSSKLLERRFVPEPTGRSNMIALVGGLATLALGAGVYGQWVSESPLDSAPVLLALGAVGLAAAAVMGDPGSAPIRVGSGGVAIERKPSQPDRIPWCEVQRVVLDPGGSVVVEGPDGQRIVAGLAHHAAAAAWIVREARERIPKRVTLDASQNAMVERHGVDEGEMVAAQPLQRAGRRCKASGKLITFEDDARLCERCGQVFHRDHVPAQCLTCDAKM